MRGIRLMDIEWVAEIQYQDYDDSELHIAAVDCPDILSALAVVMRHVKHLGRCEIISLRQRKRPW